MPLKKMIAVGVTSLLTACAIGPAYKKPDAELPQAWRDVPTQGKPVPQERWWTLYGDRTLDALVEEALTHNQDIALAAARVEEARALLQVADADRMPSVDAEFQQRHYRKA